MSIEIDDLFFDRLHVGIKTLLHLIEEARQKTDVTSRVTPFILKLEQVGMV